MKKEKNIIKVQRYESPTIRKTTRPPFQNEAFLF